MIYKALKVCDIVVEYCLYALLICVTFSIAGSVTFSWMAIGIWMIRRIAGRAFAGEPLLPGSALNKALLFFFLANILSVIASLAPQLSLKALMAKVTREVLLCLTVIDTINSKKRLRNVVAVLILAAVAIIGDAAFQNFTGKDLFRKIPLEKLTASFTSANALAGWIVVLLFVFYGALRSDMFPKIHKRIKTLVFSVLAIALFTCLAFTYSRGATVGFLAALAFAAYWFTSRFSRLKKAIVYGSLVLACAGAFFILPRSIHERMRSIVVVSDSSIERMTLWREALDIAEDFPVFGCGLNMYSNTARKYKLFPEGGIYPHNSYLQMLAETGIVGLCAFAWVIIMLFGSVTRNFARKYDPFTMCMLAAVCAVLAQSFFDTHLYALQIVIFFWFLVGLTVASSRINAAI